MLAFSQMRLLSQSVLNYNQMYNIYKMVHDEEQFDLISIFDRKKCLHLFHSFSDDIKLMQLWLIK